MSEASGQPVRLVTESVEATMAIGSAIAAAAQPGDVIGLIGDLGAGKTQMVRGIARGMGIDPAHVSSPTFVLVHEYSRGIQSTTIASNTTPKHDAHAPAPPAPPAPPVPPVLVHIDAYRLRTADELETIGWDTQSDPPGRELRRDAVVVIEWADRMTQSLGEDWLEVRLDHAGGREGNRREITIVSHGHWCERELPKIVIDVLQAGATHTIPMGGVCHASQVHHPSTPRTPPHPRGSRDEV